MDYLTYLDLHKNELRNAVMHPLVVAPSNPVEGQFYYNSTDKKAYQYNGTTWVPLGELNVIETIVVNGTALTPSSKTVNITVPTDLGDLTNEAGYIKQADIPEGAAASSTTPAMDGTAAAGSETAFARGDHVHPTDTTRLAANLKGAAGGVAELDQNGKVPSSQLPGYVDDVIEGYFYDGAFYEEDTHTTEITGESGKIYSDLTTNKLYRWGGSAYAEISASLALGETSSTAYRGDRGKTAYDHSQTTSGNPHNVTASDVGLGNVDNTSDATKKTNFTGSIADGDTGFVTGDAAYDALALKLDKAGGTMSGDIVMGSNKITDLAAPTADGDAANKAYVDDACAEIFKWYDLPIGATETPLMDGSASVGFSGKWAREDHVHPTDTSRAPLASPAFTGTPTAPTAAAGTNTTQIATTAFVQSAVGGLIKTATGTIGTNATSASVSYTGTLINAYATMGGEIVGLDIDVSTSGTVVFSTGATPPNAVTCVVVSA